MIMWQSLAAYLIVALAGAWVAWRVLLPGSLRARLRRAVKGPKSAGCGDGCGCSD